MADVKEARVPDIGGSAVPVIEILVKVGDRVEKDQSLLTLESDKATMEVPAPFAGVIKELKVKVGDEVDEGSVIALVEADGDAAAEQPKAEAPKADASKADASSAGAQKAGAASAPASDAAKASPAKAATASKSSGPVDVTVPDIGGKPVPIIELLVKVGDRVEKDQSLMTLESDKATMDIPAPAAGVIKELKVKVGDEVNDGDLIAVLEGEGGESAAAAEADEEPAPRTDKPGISEAPAEAPKRESANADVPAGGTPRTPPVSFDASVVMPENAPYASPSVRAFARELGVDVAQVKGSGRGGRIQREDITGYVKNVMTNGAATAAGGTVSAGGGLNLLPWPKVDFSKFGDVEEKPLGRIPKISAANLARNWAMIPHVTQFEDADITELEAFRKKLGEENKELKVSPLVFQIKAVVAALKKFPQFNASLDAAGETLTLKKYFNVGIAVDTPDGLVVPVIRNADKKGLLELAAELSEISKKARDKKLTGADMQGGCFSISSLGGIGGTAFTPIVNAPEVAILGVSKAAMKPVWNGKEFVPRLMLPMSLSYDHRVIDGALAARFAVYLATQLGDIRRLLL